MGTFEEMLTSDCQFISSIMNEEAKVINDFTQKAPHPTKQRNAYVRHASYYKKKMSKLREKLSTYHFKTELGVQISLELNNLMSIQCTWLGYMQIGAKTGDPKYLAPIEKTVADMNQAFQSIKNKLDKEGAA